MLEIYKNATNSVLFNILLFLRDNTLTIIYFMYFRKSNKIAHLIHFYLHQLKIGSRISCILLFKYLKSNKTKTIFKMDYRVSLNSFAKFYGKIKYTYRSVFCIAIWGRKWKVRGKKRNAEEMINIGVFSLRLPRNYVRQ